MTRTLACGRFGGLPKAPEDFLECKIRLCRERRVESSEQLLKRRLREIDCRCRFGKLCWVLSRIVTSSIGALVDNPPDATSESVAAGIVEFHFVVADDSVVEVRYVEGPVWSHLQIGRAKPWVAADEKVRFFLSVDR
jgi:hypothetical protein